jgi:hemophore-related protein
LATSPFQAVIGRALWRKSEGVYHMPFSTKLAAATGGVAFALIAGSGIAAAAPDPILNTTCSYNQVISALHAQSPADADQFTANGVATGWLQTFLNAPPDQRQQLYTQAQGLPQFQQNRGMINRVATTCNNF